ncbi:MAG: hypothetical protein OXU23_00935 [Candidatus Poribacteria bacterium]|nr:hypothetical protein [Candidatus Poribacteria bacterium]
MYRDILTNKWVLGGVGFLIVLSIACVLWYQHDIAPHRKAAAEAEEVARQWEENQQAKQKAVRETETTSPQAPAKNTSAAALNPSGLPQIGEIVDGRIFLGTEPPSPELLAQFGVRPPTQDEIISPYGFGPYPELPEGFGPITWPRKSADSELRIRVKIKLLKQGVPVKGSVMSDGLVYPILKGVRYVRWGETSDGRQYLRETLGHPDDNEYIKTVADAKFATWESVTPADFPGIQIIPMEEGGIDPYTFLNLPK